MEAYDGEVLRRGLVLEDEVICLLMTEAERWAHIVHGVLTGDPRLYAEARASGVAPATGG